MEEPVTAQPPETPKPATPGPVMDVMPPASKPATGASPEPMAIAPPEEAGSKPRQPVLPTTSKPQPKASQPKPRAAGVNAAIFATVIIVFGLALMAVYAYLTQNK